MTVLQLIDELERRVPPAAPAGTRWKGEARVATPGGAHLVAVAARIDDKGRRREQYLCDGVRVERHVLLRLTCAEGECPQAQAVRRQWLEFHGRTPAPPRCEGPQPKPLIEDVPVAVGQHQCIARPARFSCYTPCPNRAHPPMTIAKTGYDLFEDGAYLGGGLAERAGVMQPRLPSVDAAEAFVLARHLEAMAALGELLRPAGPDGGAAD